MDPVRHSDMRWDRVSGTVAMLVGILALAAAAYTAYLQRQQVRAAVWPYVFASYSQSSSSFRVVVDNKGVGPALIRSVVVRVDGHVVSRWEDAFRLALKAEPPYEYTYSFIHGRVLAGGESVDILTLRDAALAEAFGAAWKGRFGIDICYCSILEDCWLLSESAASGEPVARCPAPGRDTFQQ
jgi:hypothetical protein